MAGRPTLRQSLGLPTRVEPPPGALSQKRHTKVAGLGVGGGGRPSSHGRGAAAGGQNRRRTHVLSQGSRPSSVAVGQGRLGIRTSGITSCMLNNVTFSHKRSSVYGQGVHSQPRKEPRPLSDKCMSYSTSTLVYSICVNFYSISAKLH